MDRRITSRLNMANAVTEVCDTRTDVVALVPAFVLLVAALKGRIVALNDLMKRLTTNASGISEDKNAWKSRLSLLLSIVCGAGVAYSRKLKDVVLEKNFGYAESTLYQLRDTELIQTAKAIMEEQANIAAQLVDYGITVAFMSDVAEALVKFEEKNPKPIANVYTSEADRNELLDKAFGLSEFVLQDMMKSALVYKVLDINFYKSLENASRISKVGIRHEVEEGVKKEAQEPPATLAALEDMVNDLNSMKDAPAALELSSNGV